MALPAPDLLLRDIAACIGFYTRLPVSVRPGRSFAAAQWAAPVVGAGVGLGMGLLLWLVSAVGVPAGVAAAFALAAGVWVTGALHEDGLADVADGFGGGVSRADKLAIMKDSRLGTYGGLALMLALLVRWAAVTALAAAAPLTMIAALVAAHAASRATIPLFMLRLPSARPGGVADGVGRIEGAGAVAAIAIGFVLLLPCGLLFAAACVALLAGVFLIVASLALKQIGGQTGDVLGSLQQCGEIAVLAAAATLLI